MAEPISLIILGTMVAGVTASAVTVSAGVAVTGLAYKVYKDRKKRKADGYQAQVRNLRAAVSVAWS
jgi:uncharacterized membrane protein YebE (DUF533 family)